MKTFMPIKVVWRNRTQTPGVLAAIILGMGGVGARAELLSYEGFEYDTGASIVGQDGGLGFSQPWQLNNSQGVFTNQAASLSYTDARGNALLTTGGSLLIQGATEADVSAQPNRLLSYARGTNAGGFDGGTTWVSFLAVRQGPTIQHSTLPFNPYPRSANLSLYNNVGASNQEKLAMGNTALTESNVVALLPIGNIANMRPTGVSFSQTNFIVVQIDHVPGAHDNAYIFVNPLLGAEPDVSSADNQSEGAFDFSFNRIRPFAGGNRPAAESPYAEMVLDEIRIGETYADVAPFRPVLRAERNGNNIRLEWDGGFHLQSAEEITGDYVTIVGATSPHEAEIAGARRFFRLSQW